MGAVADRLRAMLPLRRNRPTAVATAAKGLTTTEEVAVHTSRRGLWSRILEPFTGAWQKNVFLDFDGILSNWAVFACVTRIASDCGKLRIRLMTTDPKNPGHIPREVKSTTYSPMLRRPNRYQLWQKFIVSWVASKLLHGNAYILKERDGREIVTALHVLDPLRVRPFVTPNGEVYYRVKSDRLAQIEDDDVFIPAREIIHDTMVTLHHPLVGVSPIAACGLAATQGVRIQENSANFFGNMSRPGGILTAPGDISDETADRLKAHWEKEYSGNAMGKIAVLGDGLRYEALSVNPVDSDMIAQLRMSAEMVCSTFHVPVFKVGMGTIPAGQKVADLNQIYYADCLQEHLESIEALLDDGIQPAQDGGPLAFEFDLDGLLRMDAQSLIAVLVEGLKGIGTPNEARAKLGLPPVTGGDTPYLQEQNFSLAALAKRDAQDNPWAAATPPAPPPAAPAPPGDEEEDEEQEPSDEVRELAEFLLRGLTEPAEHGNA